MPSLSIAAYFPFARVKIVGHKPNAAATVTTIGVEPDLRFKPLCHGCGEEARSVHSTGHVRFIRDLDLGPATNFLAAHYRKVYCDKCQGVRVEEQTFCDAGKRMTLRFIRMVFELCKVLTVADGHSAHCSYGDGLSACAVPIHRRPRRRSIGVVDGLLVRNLIGAAVGILTGIKMPDRSNASSQWAFLFISRDQRLW